MSSWSQCAILWGICHLLSALYHGSQWRFSGQEIDPLGHHSCRMIKTHSAWMPSCVLVKVCHFEDTSPISVYRICIFSSINSIDFVCASCIAAVIAALRSSADTVARYFSSTSTLEGRCCPST
mmetsp:Transcript_14473/g.27600  ORF Transcript_14473/g.27600 Transcript_14473/m.27600 type:complete len:123 (-) Transcript_14473:588-956(-)